MLLDASLTVLQNGCAFDQTCSTFAVRMGAVRNSTLTIRNEPALKAALKAAQAEQRFIAKKEGT